MDVQSAERAIAAILEKLERDTDSIVESVSLTDVDVTGLTDTREQIRRSVNVTMKRMPGTRWR